MRHALNIVILAALMALLSACARNEFSLEFSLPSDAGSSFRVVYHASNSKGGLVVETVAALQNGRGVLKCITRYPAVVFISSSPGSQPLAVYATKGDRIKISGDSRDALSWAVEGNEVNEAWTQWRRDNAATLQKRDPDEVNAAVARYVEANPGSQLSTLLLATTFSRRADESLYARLRGMLTGKALDRRLLDACSQCDNIHILPSAPARIGALRLHTLTGKARLLRPDSARASILYFWVTGAEGRPIAIDSLKALSAAYPDSSARNIADISLDPDSVNWASPLKYDSLRHTVRAWMPRGTADPRLMRMGVARVPFLIVTDSCGRQIYRGDDISDATVAFRSLMKGHSSPKP